MPVARVDFPGSHLSQDIITGAFLFPTFGGFLHVPTPQIYCLTGAIISETHIIIIINNTTRSSTICLQIVYRVFFSIVLYNPRPGFFLLPGHLGGFIERCS
jgi:hypothetical protein